MIFGTLPGGAPVELFELSSDKLTVRISNYGGRIISVVKDGMDMIVGPKHFEDMLKDTCYCGAICGRVANRIAKGRFSIDGDSHSVAVNNGPNHLHGGVQGFDSKIWQVQEATRNTLVLTLHSADGEENYPGNLEVVATYTVVEETLHLRLEAYADAATIVNLTNHAYWNLSGKPTIDSMTLEVLQREEAAAFAMEDVKAQAFRYKDVVVPAMEALRAPADELEMLVDKADWPFPTYGDLMFEV